MRCSVHQLALCAEAERTDRINEDCTGAAFYDLEDVATDGSAVHFNVEILFFYVSPGHASARFHALVNAGRLLAVRGQSLLRAERRVGLRPDAVVVRPCVRVIIPMRQSSRCLRWRGSTQV